MCQKEEASGTKDELCYMSKNVIREGIRNPNWLSDAAVKKNIYKLQD